MAKGELRIHDTSLASSSAAPIGDKSGMYSDASKARTLAPSTSPLAYAPLPGSSVAHCEQQESGHPAIFNVLLLYSAPSGWSMPHISDHVDAHVARLEEHGARRLRTLHVRRRVVAPRGARGGRRVRQSR